jgi:hypothetical protein
MRVQTRLPLRGGALAVGLAIGLAGAHAVAAQTSSAPGAAISRWASSKASPWSGFQPQVFDSAAASATGGGWRVKLTPPSGDLRHIALHFSDVAASTGKGFSIEIRDSGARLLASYDADFLAANPSFTTPPLKPGAVTVQVRGAPSAGDLAFKIDQMIVALPRDSLHPQSLIPGMIIYDWMNPAQRKLARGVVLLTINKKEACSGFLIGGGRVVTAQHCLEKSDSYAQSAGQPVRRCADITIAFDYTVLPYGAVVNPNCKSVDPISDPAADVAILRLTGSPPGPPGRELTLAANDPVLDLPLQLFEEPSDLPVSVKLGCQVRGTPAAPKFEHDCNTSGGASGSPVMNLDGEVVGVHTDGFLGDGATEAELNAAWYHGCHVDGHCPTNKATLVSALKAALN